MYKLPDTQIRREGFAPVTEGGGGGREGGGRGSDWQEKLVGGLLGAFVFVFLFGGFFSPRRCSLVFAAARRRRQVGGAEKTRQCRTS